MSNAALKSATLKTMVKRVVFDLFEQIADDPDRGLEIEDWVKERLAKLNKGQEVRPRLTPLAAVKKKLG